MIYKKILLFQSKKLNLSGMIPNRHCFWSQSSESGPQSNEEKQQTQYSIALPAHLRIAKVFTLISVTSQISNSQQNEINKHFSAITTATAKRRYFVVLVIFNDMRDKVNTNT